MCKAIFQFSFWKDGEACWGLEKMGRNGLTDCQ